MFSCKTAEMSFHYRLAQCDCTEHLPLPRCVCLHSGPGSFTWQNVNDLQKELPMMEKTVAPWVLSSSALAEETENEADLGCHCPRCSLEDAPSIG